MIQQKLLSFALLGAGWVLWLLVALSVACVALAIERALHLALNRTPASVLRPAVSAFMRDGDCAAFLARLDGLRGAEARILAAGLEAAASGGPDAVEEAMAAQVLFERSRMERGLILLGTTGANAPFVGLFGTVLGIIEAFHDLSRHQAEAASAVMAGISEALVSTAVGLMVAIPAVVLYNAFQRAIRGRLTQAESLSHLVLARLRCRAEEPALAEQPVALANEGG